MTYYNGTKFTWTMGRRLESATSSGGTKITYTYNADGLLTSKKVGIYKLNYYWNGDKLTAQTDGVNTWYFRYDGDTPISLEFNGIEYYYVTNLQGDVIAILDSNGAVAAEYSYDAWGNYTITKDTNTIAIDNPLRYRGYYYDAHIGLYYLQSRFYDANTGRFINADEPVMMYLGVNNLFGYCDNNPIGDTDPSGYLNMSSSKVSKGNYKITVSLSDRDIRNIKLGVTSFGLIFGIACDVVAIVGGIPSMGISVVAAAIASVVIGVVVGTVNAYIDYKNYGKGAKITFKLTYKTLTTYIPIYKRYWGVYYIVGWRKVLIPYAYINGIPRLTWNK